MARCKEELRAQGVTALPRTCPEHGIKGCPVLAPDYLEGRATPGAPRSCATCRHGELAHGFMLDEGPQPGCRAPGCECKSYADPYAKLTVLEDKVIPRKNGLQPALPMTFGELRKLIRELDERGVPDSAKITVKGPEGEIFTGEFCDLRLQWWTVEES